MSQIALRPHVQRVVIAVAVVVGVIALVSARRQAA